MSQKQTGGLAGVIAGRTNICAVGKEGAGLTCRGCDIHDLADNACFEEVAHLLHRGPLPNAGNFLHLLHGAPPGELHRRTLDAAGRTGFTPG